jgi:hypothetical protein
LSIIDDEGIRTFPHDAIPRYNPIALAVVEAEPMQILERRRTDPPCDLLGLGQIRPTPTTALRAMRHPLIGVLTHGSA